VLEQRLRTRFASVKRGALEEALSYEAGARRRNTSGLATRIGVGDHSEAFLTAGT
jgi:hypothetical protein